MKILKIVGRGGHIRMVTEEIWQEDYTEYKARVKETQKQKIERENAEMGVFILVEDDFNEVVKNGN